MLKKGDTVEYQPNEEIKLVGKILGIDSYGRYEVLFEGRGIVPLREDLLKPVQILLG